MSTSTNDPADLLTVILDLNPLAWADLESGESQEETTSLVSVIESFLIFANSHLALRHENAIAVYGASLGSSELLYSSLQAKPITTKSSQPSGSRDANTYQSFRILNDSIASGVKQLATLTQSSSMTGKQPGIVKALAKALCHINRLARENENKKESLKARILILSVSSDAPGQYIPMMNCIFSAQKSTIPIDVCKISKENAVFLQQAAHLTEGIYYQIEKPKAILQYLTMIFLPGLAARKFLNLPKHQEVDFRAACFCHREIIDVGYVCSVCLSNWQVTGGSSHPYTSHESQGRQAAGLSPTQPPEAIRAFQ
ncbi:RNA polymerase II transcription factor B subunit 4 [Puccinia graminis f. sp. tritici]|uniref:General transcription and DNA repair factor IIH subunit TFB4 n=1 Tax=Puccinia graminis f. sp. tritici TaxID=56615 RepID=A0A5B0SA69_PUCGR|nr:RNA polymerase II transcription factor B subunit 4 [Puccinia graminis f. sp. tritici]